MLGWLGRLLRMIEGGWGVWILFIRFLGRGNIRFAVFFVWLNFVAVGLGRS